MSQFLLNDLPFQHMRNDPYDQTGDPYRGVGRLRLALSVSLTMLIMMFWVALPTAVGYAAAGLMRTLAFARGNPAAAVAVCAPSDRRPRPMLMKGEMDE